MITLRQAVDYLRMYQEWRRGEVEHPQPSPTRVGACIDVVLAAAEKSLARTGKTKP